MRELDHDNLEYEGAPGEAVTISVTPNGTTQLVHFTLDGDTSVLPAGSDINFTLGNTSGQRTDLQIVMDFNHQGRYDVVIENVSNCSKDPQDTGTCTNRVNGPPKEFLLFAFFVE